MGNDMKVKKLKNTNIRCHNCGKEWLTEKQKTPKFCYVCHSTNLKRFTEFTDLKDKVKGTFPAVFPYKLNWGKPAKSVK